MTHVGAGVGAASSKECSAVLLSSLSLSSSMMLILPWAGGCGRGGVRGRGRPEVHALVTVTLVEGGHGEVELPVGGLQVKLGPLSIRSSDGLIRRNVGS